MCVRIHKRENQVVEIEESSLSRGPIDSLGACSYQRFNKNYLTLFVIRQSSSSSISSDADGGEREEEMIHPHHPIHWIIPLFIPIQVFLHRRFHPYPFHHFFSSSSFGKHEEKSKEENEREERKKRMRDVEERKDKKEEDGQKRNPVNA